MLKPDTFTSVKYMNTSPSTAVWINNHTDRILYSRRSRKILPQDSNCEIKSYKFTSYEKGHATKAQLQLLIWTQIPKYLRKILNLPTWFTDRVKQTPAELFSDTFRPPLSVFTPLSRLYEQFLFRLWFSFEAEYNLSSQICH